MVQDCFQLGTVFNIRCAIGLKWVNPCGLEVITFRNFSQYFCVIVMSFFIMKTSSSILLSQIVVIFSSSLLICDNFFQNKLSTFSELHF